MERLHETRLNSCRRNAQQDPRIRTRGHRAPCAQMSRRPSRSPTPRRRANRVQAGDRESPHVAETGNQYAPRRRLPRHEDLGSEDDRKPGFNLGRRTWSDDHCAEGLDLANYSRKTATICTVKSGATAPANRPDGHGGTPGKSGTRPKGKCEFRRARTTGAGPAPTIQRRDWWPSKMAAGKPRAARQG